MPPNLATVFTSFFQEWAKCWVPHKKDFCKGGHCSSCSLQLSLKHASRLWKTYKYCPGEHFYHCDKKLRMQRLGLVTQLGALIDKHGGDNVIIADIPVSSWELIVAELPPAKLRKRDNLPSAAVAVEGNLSRSRWLFFSCNLYGCDHRGGLNSRIWTRMISDRLFWPSWSTVRI